MKKRLGVIGVGSAGILSLTHFCTWMDNDWDVVSIHNPAKKILGIGESTNGGFVGLLEKGLRFSIGNQADMDALDATIKYGSKFMEWREHSWINPLLDGNTAIHFDNNKFFPFAFSRLKKLWPEKFKVIEGDVKEVRNYADKVGVVIDGHEQFFDYVVDCMGFPQNFNRYTYSDCSPVNRALISSQMAGDFKYEPYTDHIACKHGWMFGVPLQSRKTFGYMYNDQLCTPEEAAADMRAILGQKELDASTGRGISTAEYIFRCYYANEFIDGRVAKNGNKALFFEPLIANSIFLYIYTARLTYDYIMGAAHRDSVNAQFVKAVQEMEDVISYYYQGGSKYDTPFWRHAVPFATQRLEKRDEFRHLMQHYGYLKSRGVVHHGPTYAFVPLTWEIVDEQLGYGYIDPASKDRSVAHSPLKTPGTNGSSSPPKMAKVGDIAMGMMAARTAAPAMAAKAAAAPKAPTSGGNRKPKKKAAPGPAGKKGPRRK